MAGAAVSAHRQRDHVEHAALERGARFGDPRRADVARSGSVSPAAANSLSPYGRSRDVSFIASARSAETMLAVNSGTSRTLRSESLSLPPPGRAFGAKPTIGGSDENALKYE